jgi:hypothetical protein
MTTISYLFIFIVNKWNASIHPPPGPARRNHNLLEPMLVWPFGLCSKSLLIIDLFLFLCFLQVPCSFQWAHSTNFDPLKQEAILVIIKSAYYFSPTARVVTRTFSDGQMDGRTDDRMMAAGASVT